MKRTVITGIFICLTVALLAGGNNTLDSIDSLIDKNRLAEASKQISRMKKGGILKKNNLLDLARKMIREKRYNETIFLLKENTRHFPNHPTSYYRLSNVYKQIGNRKGEVESYRKGVDISSAQGLRSILQKEGEGLFNSVEQVINRHLERIGGIENIRKIRTLTIHGEGSAGGSITWSLTRYKKYPHFVRQDYNDGYFDSSDGTRFYQGKGDRFTVYRDPKESPLSRVNDIYDDFIDYSEKNISYRFGGLESIGSAVFYKLIKTYADNGTDVLLFDVRSGLLSIIRTLTSMGMELINLHHYKSIPGCGVRYPHLRVTTFDHERAPHLFTIRKIEMNKPLKTSLFIQDGK